MDKDEVQDHADAGSRVEHAAKKSCRSVYLIGGKTAECSLSSP